MAILTHKRIADGVKKYRARINFYSESILSLQRECDHPIETLTKAHGSNTGNYDLSNDWHWTVFDCGICGKHWTEEGSK